MIANSSSNVLLRMVGAPRYDVFGNSHDCRTAARKRKRYTNRGCKIGLVRSHERHKVVSHTYFGKANLCGKKDHNDESGIRRFGNM